MGMSNGTIMDHEISGSSTIDKAHPAFYARVITARNELVSTRGSWCAKLADKEQFLEVDLKKPRKVTGQLIFVKKKIKSSRQQFTLQNILQRRTSRLWRLNIVSRTKVELHMRRAKLINLKFVW